MARSEESLGANGAPAPQRSPGEYLHSADPLPHPLHLAHLPFENIPMRPCMQEGWPGNPMCLEGPFSLPGTPPLTLTAQHRASPCCAPPCPPTPPTHPAGVMLTAPRPAPWPPPLRAPRVCPPRSSLPSSTRPSRPRTQSLCARCSSLRSGSRACPSSAPAAGWGRGHPPKATHTRLRRGGADCSRCPRGIRHLRSTGQGAGPPCA